MWGVRVCINAWRWKKFRCRRSGDWCHRLCRARRKGDRETDRCVGNPNGGPGGLRPDRKYKLDLPGREEAESCLKQFGFVHAQATITQPAIP